MGFERVVRALRQIRSFFSKEHDAAIVVYLDEAVRLGESSDPLKQLHLESILKSDKYLWLGMGTIADVSFGQQHKDRAFRDAYLELAEACAALGMASIYSQDVLKIFGEWKRKGL